MEGDPTDPETLHAVDHGHDAAQDTEGTFEQGDRVRVQSPLTLMEAVAATDEEFAEVYHEADTTDDGVPDENLAAVYDELFEVAPEQAAQFIEHTEDGEYRTVMVYVPVEQTNEMADRSESMHGLADEMEASADIDSDDELAVTPVGFATLNNAELAVLADDILETMLLALAGVLLLLAGVYRFERGSATLGVTTVIPIVLVLGMVFGAMYLFDVPLTFLTALLMSITIGLGIDYNIHVSDRFAQELEDGRTTVDALLAATTGTGGALLGSALTSGAAFLTLMLHPSAQIESFGAIVVFALLSSFLLSVFVLPSLLYVWAERIRGVDAVDPVSAVPSDD